MEAKVAARGPAPARDLDEPPAPSAIWLHGPVTGAILIPGGKHGIDVGFGEIRHPVEGERMGEEEMSKRGLEGAPAEPLLAVHRDDA